MELTLQVRDRRGIRGVVGQVVKLLRVGVVVVQLDAAASFVPLDVAEPIGPDRPALERVGLAAASDLGERRGLAGRVGFVEPRAQAAAGEAVGGGRPQRSARVG